ncbi:hypothetical protein E2C01_000299 [Portunus trituberculatus]|uniref:Uncharacterized protein n=1 Tax=Portunus trituberculatus TaxID=210409 RepID=A0A5B7CJ94_PORTR|nr:hypothetical protein [Portunus trituberculatus]
MTNHYLGRENRNSEVGALLNIGKSGTAPPDLETQIVRTCYFRTFEKFSALRTSAPRLVVRRYGGTEVRTESDSHSSGPLRVTAGSIITDRALRHKGHGTALTEATVSPVTSISERGQCTCLLKLHMSTIFNNTE